MTEAFRVTPSAAISAPAPTLDEPASPVLVPPKALVDRIHSILEELLTRNPAATSSESYVQHHIEFALLEEEVEPRYYLRIGINYHGAKVQHIQYDAATGGLIGWNPGGDALGVGQNAQILLAGVTIFDRDADEPMMNDTKVGGGEIPRGRYVRIEFKVRGFLGKTKNLAGSQLEKDIDLIKTDRADLMVVCLSETAHRKWRGEGSAFHATRRTGTDRFAKLLVEPDVLTGTDALVRDIDFEGQHWSVSSQLVVGAPDSAMPGAKHFITLAWRRL